MKKIIKLRKNERNIRWKKLIYGFLEWSWNCGVFRLHAFFWRTSYFCDFKGTMYKFHSIWALLPAVHHFPCHVAFQWSHFKATNLPCLNNFTTFCCFFLICCNYLEVQYSLLNPTIKYNSKKIDQRKFLRVL